MTVHYNHRHDRRIVRKQTNEYKTVISNETLKSSQLGTTFETPHNRSETTKAWQQPLRQQRRLGIDWCAVKSLTIIYRMQSRSLCLSVTCRSIACAQFWKRPVNWYNTCRHHASQDRLYYIVCCVRHGCNGVYSHRMQLDKVVFFQVQLQDRVFNGSKDEPNILRVCSKHKSSNRRQHYHLLIIITSQSIMIEIS